MKPYQSLLSIYASIGCASIIDRQLLTYAPIPADAYTPTVNASILTLLEFVKSRPELSNLTAVLEQSAGQCMAVPRKRWVFRYN